MDGWMDTTHTHTHTHKHTHAHTPTHTYTDTHTPTLTHTHTYTDTHTDRHTQTDTHTHTFSPVASPFYVHPLIKHFLAINTKCSDSTTEPCLILMQMCRRKRVRTRYQTKSLKLFFPLIYSVNRITVVGHCI